MVMDSAIRTGVRLLPPIYLLLYPKTLLTPLHLRSLTTNQLQDIYYLIERISIRLFSNTLEHLHTTTHTLILAYTQSSFKSQKSHVLVTWLRNRGQVCTQILPPSIYFYLFVNFITPLQNITWGNRLFYSYNKKNNAIYFYLMTDDLCILFYRV